MGQRSACVHFIFRPVSAVESLVHHWKRRIEQL